MPVGSTIIAIDLAPIKDIPRVMTLQADITSPKTHAKVRKLMQSNRADVVLNDGAPNVGAAWITDSSNQLDLCLASVKFSTLFLRKGGWFITKVFRSEHYNSLLYVLNQFWDQVIPTKPKASRDTSAELFIVCKGYKAPTVIDPRLLDSQYVFSDLDDLVKKHPPSVETVSRTAFDFRSVTVAGFLNCDAPLDVLTTVSAIQFDTTALSVAANAHPATTGEIRELLRDLKVIGKADRRVLLKWRRSMRSALLSGSPAEIEADVDAAEQDEEKEMDGILNEFAKKRRREERAAKRRKETVRAQLIKRLQKNLAAPTDAPVATGRLFTPVMPDEGDGRSWDELVEENLEYLEGLPRLETVDSDGELRGPVRFAREVEVASEPEDEDTQKAVWYNQSIFDDDSADEIEDDRPAPVQTSEDEHEMPKMGEEEEEVKEVKEEDKAAMTAKDFDATAFALAKRLLRGKKSRNEVIDDSFNRFVRDDGPLPSWFEEDEKKHNRPMIPVSKDDVLEWKKKMRDVNEVATKRVIEARARKKQKALQKMKNLQEKADEIAEKEGLDERSKLHIMKQIYDKGMKTLDRAPKIVVTQKRDMGKPHYSKQGSQRVKIVDPRLKKDLRGEKKGADRVAKAGFKKKKSKYIHRRK
jgi:AdoMet-dependent rRNA methyltransferase SPB1